jgi:hypothetical protein
VVPAEEPQHLRWRTVRVFRQTLVFEDAIELHAFAPLEALPCMRPMPNLSDVHALTVATVNSGETLKAIASSVSVQKHLLRESNLFYQIVTDVYKNVSAVCPLLMFEQNCALSQMNLHFFQTAWVEVRVEVRVEDRIEVTSGASTSLPVDAANYVEAVKAATTISNPNPNLIPDPDSDPNSNPNPNPNPNR